MTMLSFRVEPSDAELVNELAGRLGIGRSELLREALRSYLLRLACEIDAARWERTPPTEDESALAAVADWGPAEDWSDWIDAAG